MYIAVDLKVIEGKAAAAARAAGCEEERVGWGLTRLWHRVWCDGSDYLSRDVLAGVFGSKGLDELLSALVAFGFLEALEQRWRVRGASRYLRLKESRREGARKTNAARSKSDALERSGATLPPTLNNALSPSTEHRAPNTKEEETTLSTSSTVLEVFEHWRGKVSPKAKLDRKRKGLIEARLREGYSAEELKATVDRYLASPFHQGQNDRQQKYLGLHVMFRDAEHVEALQDKPNNPRDISDETKRWFEENAGKEISF